MAGLRAMRRAGSPMLLCALLLACTPNADTPAPAVSTTSPVISPTTVLISPTPSPTFRATVAAAPRARMTSSWRAGCPVPISRLRLLTVRHYGFDGAVREGELVVHQDQTRNLTTVFRALFVARFPIERMELVDRYGSDDDRSMAANNTSAFNCRASTDRPGVWSQHAYGRAIDINPVQNPYVVSARDVRPPAGRAYVDRWRRRMGMIHADDVVVRAFAAVGWGWGGNFRSAKDPQHFSAGGG